MEYPAAHSMDSCWFAVDLDGRVAYFETGESGAIPIADDFPLGGESGVLRGNAMELGELIVEALRVQAATDPELAAILGPLDELGTVELDPGDDRAFAIANGLGIAVYSCDDAVATPYVRERHIGEGLDLARLPSRSRFGPAARLPVRFADTILLQPGEYVRVASYSEGNVWYDRDGRTHSDPGQPRPPDIEDHEPSIPTQLAPMDRTAWLELVAKAMADGDRRRALRKERKPAKGDDRVLGFFRRLWGR